MIKLLVIIIISLGIIYALLTSKFKKAYAVIFNNEIIGYVQNKDEFNEKVQNEVLKPKNENIAFVSLDNVEYSAKIASRTIFNEDEIIEKLKENAKDIYKVYEIKYSDDVESILVNSLEEAESTVQTLKEQYSEIEVNLSIAEIYLETESSEEAIKLAKEKLEERLKEQVEEKKKQDAINAKSVNGIYIACNPVSTGKITSRYGARESVRDHVHQGIDIGATTGTVIKAAADGKVISAGVSGGYGNLIIIDHGNGVKTYYGHCSKITTTVGKYVTAGEKIGEVGSTGNSTGPHLHFEIRLNDAQINPEKYIY